MNQSRPHKFQAYHPEMRQWRQMRQMRHFFVPLFSVTWVANNVCGFRKVEKVWHFATLEGVGSDRGQGTGEMGGREPCPSESLDNSRHDCGRAYTGHVRPEAACPTRPRNLTGKRLSAPGHDQPDDVTDQRPRHSATGRDCGLWAAAFAVNASSSRFGEGQGGRHRSWS